MGFILFLVGCALGYCIALIIPNHISGTIQISYLDPDQDTYSLALNIPDGRDLFVNDQVILKVEHKDFLDSQK